MKVQALNTSLLQGWPVCPANAWMHYEQRLESGDSMEGTNPTRFGSIVHEVSEIFHEHIMRDDEPPEPINLFYDIWKRHKLTDFEYFLLGQQNIEQFLHRQFYEREGETIGTEVVFLLDVQAEKIWVHTGVTPARVQAILKAGHVPVLSKIDRIDVVGDGRYEVYDYKTNIMPYTRWEVDNSVQLGAYDLAVRALYPDAVEVKCTYDMLRHGRYSAVYDSEQREALRQYLIATWHQISTTTKPEERINRFCRYCERRGVCDAYRAVLDMRTLPILTGPTDNSEDLAAMFDESDQLKSMAKIIDARLQEIEGIFAVKYQLAGGQPIRIGGDEEQEVYFAPNPRYEFDMLAVWDILKKHNALTLLKNVAKISNTSLERALKGKSDLKSEIMPHKHKHFVKPTMRRRIATEAPVEEESTDV